MEGASSTTVRTRSRWIQSDGHSGGEAAPNFKHLDQRFEQNGSTKIRARAHRAVGFHRTVPYSCTGECRVAHSILVGKASGVQLYLALLSPRLYLAVRN